MPKQRLSKVLSAAGVASRRKAEELIFSGRVKVAGDPITIPQTLVDPAEDSILVDGQPIRTEQKIHFALNKPKGYICSTRGNERSRPVLSLFDGIPERLFTVGRLDVDSTGLLLVTNDGAFANRVIHPSQGLEKEYVVKVREAIGPHHLNALSNGTRVEGVYVRPYRLQKMRRGTLKIIVKEGRKREVRCLCKAAGLTVITLQRTRIGNLHLGKLPLGQWRRLTQTACERIFD